jgi:ADP-heptose:LPS heptosyltransferase
VNQTSAAPLLIRFGRIGDMVLQTPLLHLLHLRYGQPCRLLSAGPWAQALFAGNPDVEQVWQLKDRHAPFLLSPECWPLLRRLREHAGPIYVSEDSLRQVPRIRRLLAHAAISADRCLFLDQFPPAQEEHWIDQLLRFGQATPPAYSPRLSCPRDGLWTAPRLFLRASDREDRQAWLHRRRLAGHPLVLLQPGNKRAMKWGHARRGDPKAWPIPQWVDLLRAMHAQLPTGIFLLCGSPTERRLLEDIRAAAAIDHVQIAADDLPLPRLIAVLEIAHSMVSVDTGPAHIAAAVGCPLVVLYGAESVQRWARRSPTQSAVIELHPGAENGSVAEISLPSVIQAWQRAAGATPRRGELRYA